MIPAEINARYQIILASKSPRRRQLLQELGLEFEVVTKDVDESYPSHLQREAVAEYIAQKKAQPFAALQPGELVITSDTIVCVDDQVLGKPQNRDEAIDMLQLLSGRSHTVISGVCLKTATKEKVFSESTKVFFKELSLAEIEYYVDHYQPFDKAGSYGIQEWIGYIGVEKIEGDYFNVVGLPLFGLSNALIFNYSNE